jgi:acetoacetyl-CoA synthetase
MPGARWFPEARLNFSENLLRRRDGADAIVFWGEDRVRRRLSHRQLYDQVARVARALHAGGVRAGDRVAAILPNMPETVVAMLASASLGAAWCSCSPDFGVQGVVDRFVQIAPKVLFAVDGYYYNGKTYDCLEKLDAIVAALPSLERVVVVPYTRADPAMLRKGAKGKGRGAVSPHPLPLISSVPT